MGWGILIGAGGILLIEAGVIIAFGISLGKEMHERYERANNTFYPAATPEDRQLKAGEINEVI